MSQIILPNSPSNQDGDAVEFTDVFSNDRAIRDVVQGNLDNANFDSGADISSDKFYAGDLAKIGMNVPSGVLYPQRDYVLIDPPVESLPAAPNIRDFPTAGSYVFMQAPYPGFALVFATVELSVMGSASSVAVWLYNTQHGHNLIITAPGNETDTYAPAPGSTTGVDTSRAPGFLCIPIQAGFHTFGLRYSSSYPGNGSALAGKRRLWVMLVGFPS